MDSSAPKPKHSMTRIISSMVIGAAVLGGSLFYLKWSSGAFRKHEKIAVVTWTEDPFWGPTEEGADDAAKDLGVDLTFIRSKPDEASQNQHIKDQLAANVDGLAIAPNNPVTQQGIINEAAAKTIVVTFDSDAPNTNRRGFVGTDDYSAGQVAGEQVRAAIPGGGKVIISVGSVDMSNGGDRREGLIDNLLDRRYRQQHPADPIEGDLKGKDYDVVATVVDRHDVDNASKLVAAAIAAHPDVKCIVGLFSYSGDAIVKAVDAAGKKGQIKVIGFDESAEEQTDVLSGAIFSSVLQDQYRCGYEIVRTLSDLCRGVAPNQPGNPRLTAFPVIVMTRGNLQELRDKRLVRSVGAK